MEEYHAKADRAMEVLFDTLESLVEKSGRSDWEVDYHVRLFAFSNLFNWSLYLHLH